jgi:hypothetical protein
MSAILKYDPRLALGFHLAVILLTVDVRGSVAFFVDAEVLDPNIVVRQIEIGLIPF